MENAVISDKSLASITSEDVRVRFVGKIIGMDEIGMFDVVDGDKKVKCLPPASGAPRVKTGDIVVVTGKVAPGDTKEDFEIRTDSVQTISSEDYIEFCGRSGP